MTFLALWCAVSFPLMLFIARAIPHTEDDPCDHLADRSGAFRQVGFDIPHKQEQ